MQESLQFVTIQRFDAKGYAKTVLSITTPSGIAQCAVWRVPSSTIPDQPLEWQTSVILPVSKPGTPGFSMESIPYLELLLKTTFEEAHNLKCTSETQHANATLATLFNEPENLPAIEAN